MSAPHVAEGRRDVLWLLAITLVAAAVAVLDRGSVAAAAALHPLAAAPHPYWVPAHAALLYVRVPLAVVAACALFLAPGLLLARAAGRARSPEEWVLVGLALAIPVVSAAAGIVQALVGAPLTGVAFVAVVTACAAFAAPFAWRAERAGEPGPLAPPHARAALALMLVAPALAVILLGPKFHWETLNGDGAHAFESTRLLLHRALPFWGGEAGRIAAFPGPTSALFAFPGSWFLRLFGEVDAAARLPVLLYLPALVAAVIELARDGRLPLGTAERALIWLAAAVYLVAMAFSATYSAYAADLALPATQDTLLMVCYLGFVLAFVRGDSALAAWFTLLTYASLPSGLILIGFWLVAALLVMRPRPWRRVGFAAAGAVACVVLAAATPRLLAVLGLPTPGREYGLAGILRYFAFLQITDWHRVLYVLVPCGILPGVALVAWRRQDALSRAVTLVAVAYFLFFFVQAHVALHHFVPAMVLPLVVYWRRAPDPGPSRTRWLAATGMAGVLALALALPVHARPHMTDRLIGRAIADRVGGYASMEPTAFRHADLLGVLFPPDWDPRVPAGTYGGARISWFRYACRDGCPSTAINYVIQPAGAPAPAGMRLLATDTTAALWLRSDSVWGAHRALRPPSPAGSRLLAVPRGILFHSVPLTNGPAILDVVQMMRRLGLRVDPLLERLGVPR